MDSPKRSKWLIGRLETGALTQEEFQKECAYWLLEKEYWDDLRPVGIPPIPNEYIEYMAMNKEQRGKMAEKFFQDNPLINWFKGKMYHAWHTNKLRIKDLCHLKRHLLPNDIEAREKYNKKILDYGKKLKYIYRIWIKKDYLLDDFGKEVRDGFRGRVV